MTQCASHYQTLEVSPHATQTEIKEAYRRLVKQYHPDSFNCEANHEKIVELNTAYEVIRDPQRRRIYDRQLQKSQSYNSTQRQQRTTAAQNSYHQEQRSRKAADAHLKRWHKEVYVPVNRLIGKILQPLDSRIKELAADPFDDSLMADFQAYLTESRQYLTKAQQTFTAQPNPAKVASVAANLYYCLDRIGDGLDELDWFTMNYDDRYLHTGKELFRIASRLQQDAQGIVQS
ncbi:J domain-containing protein [Lusitaniella coriacea LEGE 07157]|uniref:J domain-containing protein n=1 Tax=Lusitaniella coriacea LEGE 07157 TaxID=945747 RepID=A0A8J7E1P6_9CYAN|nr:DnaJ domain-containing protein [Lusitaniella coriacea]MBE9118981.1 J domain-containing protein [Lusitaniella coriacea LEGE 07157]